MGTFVKVTSSRHPRPFGLPGRFPGASGTWASVFWVGCGPRPPRAERTRGYTGYGNGHDFLRQQSAHCGRPVCAVG